MKNLESAPDRSTIHDSLRRILTTAKKLYFRTTFVEQLFAEALLMIIYFEEHLLMAAFLKLKII